MNINNPSIGTLFIIATPIGNLQDITLRALEILKSVNCIAVEDTRHSAPLLQHFGINTPMISLHEHNERERAAKLIERLEKGESIALISDAGTPLISDPGYHFVREVKALNIRVTPIPGPCAAIAALSASGLPTDRFVFEGFLPVKTKARKDRLEKLSHESRTMIFYEAPHRILDLLEAMKITFGDERIAVLARELTKLFETIHSATLAELVEWVKADANQQRGEIVLLVKGIDDSHDIENDAKSREILTLLLEELPLKQAVELAAKITGNKKNDLYQYALALKKQDSSD